MSDDESETLYTDSERSEDSDSGESLADFVADSDEEPETCPACHTEICVSNILTKKRRRTPVDHEESSNDEGDSDDSSSDYVPSEAGLSSEDDSSCDESD